jgi:DNA-directed RNA polymerase subunit K/omega
VVDENIQTEPVSEEAPAAERTFEKVPPIQSRFLFVDVAALRAKQLRRGARVRIPGADNPEASQTPLPRKPERLAMEEVRQGLVPYELIDTKPEPRGEDQ